MVSPSNFRQASESGRPCLCGSDGCHERGGSGGGGGSFGGPSSGSHGAGSDVRHVADSGGSLGGSGGGRGGGGGARQDDEGERDEQDWRSIKGLLFYDNVEHQIQVHAVGEAVGGASWASIAVDRLMREGEQVQGFWGVLLFPRRLRTFQTFRLFSRSRDFPGFRG